MVAEWVPDLKWPEHLSIAPQRAARNPSNARAHESNSLHRILALDSGRKIVLHASIGSDRLQL